MVIKLLWAPVMEKVSEKMDGKVFTITKNIMLNKEITNRFGQGSLIVLPGKYNIDRSRNKLGTIKLETTSGGRG